MPKTPSYSLEFRREAVRLLRSSGRPIPQLAAELGCSPQSLRKWTRQLDVDDGRRDGVSRDEREELRRLRRENRILTEEREILRKAVVFFAQDGRTVTVFGFIAATKTEHAVQTMCRVLGQPLGIHVWERRKPSARTRRMNP